ncbi:hypothetical protein STCU_07827 [Strigomonas culicis]|uniref:Uncharacterized protein n=1 Tax=Strigomonas culicis TaxID=28005 RepID=S9U334_9TRYP|nr:hypothetical protein STCU_07827 [Strigomonas culicis]|eukprot:EPY23184.1 hypothetical protein STCU_07827 [Strigomonas culicis]
MHTPPAADPAAPSLRQPLRPVPVVLEVPQLPPELAVEVWVGEIRVAQLRTGVGVVRLAGRHHGHAQVKSLVLRVRVREALEAQPWIRLLARLVCLAVHVDVPEGLLVLHAVEEAHDEPETDQPGEPIRRERLMEVLVGALLPVGVQLPMPVAPVFPRELGRRLHLGEVVERVAVARRLVRRRRHHIRGNDDAAVLINLVQRVGVKVRDVLDVVEPGRIPAHHLAPGPAPVAGRTCCPACAQSSCPSRVRCAHRSRCGPGRQVS